MLPMAMGVLHPPVSEERHKTDMAIRLLWILLCLLWGFDALAQEPLVAGKTVLKRWILADFEQPGGHPLALGWQPLPPEATFGFIAAQTPSDRSGGGAQAMRVTYRLPDPLPAGDPAMPEEFELSMNLIGLDASDYDHVALWIKGDAPGFEPHLDIKFLRPDATSPGVFQTGRWTIGPVSDQWQQFVIPLRQLMGINDWHGLDSFRFALKARGLQVRVGTYVIDDVELLKLETPRPPEADQMQPARKQAWEQSLGGELAAKPHLRARLNGWPRQALVNPKSLPRDNVAFLRRIAADTWRGLDALTDREHGLPLDRVHYARGDVDLEKARIGDYTSITNVGFHLLAVVAAYELKLIDATQALQRLETTLITLEKMERAHGFFFNYYNTTTLERTSHFLSFVDSSWLTAGLIVVRQAFPALNERCSRLIDEGNYRFFYDPDSKLMSHGHYVDTDQRSPFHYGTLYAESRIGSLIAIGRGDVERDHWFAMTRTLPPDFTWQTQTPKNRHEKSSNGFRWFGGYYEWKGLRYVPSWGGSVFEALMPVLVLDEKRYAARSLGRNAAIHTEIQRRYALEELNFPVWGMSPSSTPGSDQYVEYGVRLLGTAGYREGIVTPHAAALALLAEPEAATNNLRRLAERFPLYGEFGFYDAVDPKSGEVAYIHLCLNQAMILVTLADHLADGQIQKSFAKDPIVRPVLELIGHENFFD